MGVTAIPSDSNGVYSLPAGYLAITGETIQASQHNPPLEDLESAMSARLMRSGVAPMTGPLKLADGAVGSPAVQFNSGSSTGFYKTTNGIGVSVGGTKIAEFTSSGLARMIGELIPWTRLTAPVGCVFPVGQTLSRTTYADLWGVAQVEIAAGNAWFNNGDGSTTFGIGDMRGCTLAARDNMGGSAAGRLSTYFLSADSTILGARSGSQSITLAQANLPNIVPTFAGNIGAVSVTSTGAVATATQGLASTLGGSTLGILTMNTINSTGVFQPTGSVSSINGNQTQTAFTNVQPTIICNFVLYAGA